MPTSLQDALQTYIVESRELLAEMESALLAVCQADAGARPELVNAIFRAAHTIKGSAGLFGLDRIVTFTHVVESALDEVRAGTLVLDAALVSLLLACGDHVAALVADVDLRRTDADPAVAALGAPLLAQLRQHLGAAETTPPDDGDAAPGDRPADGADANGGHWHLSLRFGPGVLRNGMDPMAFIRYLDTLGRVVNIATLADAMPGADAMDPECCYLGFEIGLQTQADRAAIENVFEFVRDDCQLRIVPRPPASPALPAAASGLAGTPGGPARATPVADAAPSRPRAPKDGRGADTHSIRVDADKLDRLINLVGELVIAAAGAQLVARSTRIVELQESHSTVATLVEQVRDASLQLRMVKIGSTFNRFKRVVHDVAIELAKDIALEVSGEDTELDKTVVERIADPLTHLVRNAMDHGIEPADVRAAQGKPAQGTVRLNAFHDSGSIVIEVGDDGGGLDRERILAKAVARGLVEPGKHLSDADTFALVFEPGFSTAEKVTNLSGRGVGMDVVKRNIAALRGSVDIASTPGRGTTVTVRLPLTLAIIDGFQVRIGQSVFVLPLDMVEECVAFACDDARGYTDLRGEVLPVIRLRELFDVQGARGSRDNLVVVRHGQAKAGLMVDALLGEAQTVIKPLSRMFGQVRGISGSTILGNGEVALILDVPALFNLMNGPADGSAVPALASH
ncbi:chemotaxis protein CheA [Aquabacterium sp. J223]|uniref:chemotaxis protein CheA n=1 Tax=Aquabacterium sp. J223 TaxID=2898431 RepID=UPI0021AD7779|nr:chemotaxis protein CheA [Aquabacterium sp. J223]UUX94541.1 chemotaxis protein CheA [Aquabacterium sp. J223]